MSTRAIYSFETEYGVVHVYKQHDGYPTGAADALKAAQAFAWPLPRYEGDDFAAAFVAANKMPYYLQPGMQELTYRLQRERPASDMYDCEITQTFKVPKYAFGKSPTGQGGGVRLIPQGLQPAQFAGDAEYRYVISTDGKIVTAFACNYWDGADKETFLFRTSLARFARRAKAWEKEQNQ